MMTKNIIIVGLLIVSIILGILYFKPTKTPDYQNQLNQLVLKEKRNDSIITSNNKAYLDELKEKDSIIKENDWKIKIAEGVINYYQKRINEIPELKPFQCKDSLIQLYATNDSEVFCRAYDTYFELQENKSINDTLKLTISNNKAQISLDSTQVNLLKSDTSLLRKNDSLCEQKVLVVKKELKKQQTVKRIYIATGILGWALFILKVLNL